jgi:hypothetical protein
MTLTAEKMYRAFELLARHGLGERMSERDKEHFTRVLNKLTEGGLLPRGKTSDLVAEYDSAVQQIADEDRVLAEAEDASRQEPVDGTGSVWSGTLTVTGPDETHAITDEELAALDDEPTTVGTKKRGKLKV